MPDCCVHRVSPWSLPEEQCTTGSRHMQEERLGLSSWAFACSTQFYLCDWILIRTQTHPLIFSGLIEHHCLFFRRRWHQPKHHSHLDALLSFDQLWDSVQELRWGDWNCSARKKGPRSRALILITRKRPCEVRDDLKGRFGVVGTETEAEGTFLRVWSIHIQVTHKSADPSFSVDCLLSLSASLTFFLTYLVWLSFSSNPNLFFFSQDFVFSLWLESFQIILMLIGMYDFGISFQKLSSTGSVIALCSYCYIYILLYLHIA